MAIKNWTVKAQGVTGGSRGLAAYGRYLEDANHRNHRGKTAAITPVAGDWRELVVRQTALMTQRNMERPRGGRPVETLAQSFVVSLPPELRPTPEQWRKIASAAIKGLTQGLSGDQGLETGDDLKGHLFANVHENPNNPHLNIVIGKLGANGEIRKKITQRAALHRMKTAVNDAVLRVMGVSNEKYEPRAPRPRTQADREAQGDYHRRNLTGWQYQRRLAEVEGQIDDRNADLVALDRTFEGLHDEFARLQRTAESIGQSLDSEIARKSRVQAANLAFNEEVINAQASPAPAPVPPNADWYKRKQAKQAKHERKRGDDDPSPSR